MQTFDAVYDQALANHPDLDARLGGGHVAKTPAELIATPDDRWLSMMTRCVFQSGFVWKVIEAKWDGFEAAFEGFDPGRISFYSDDDVARLVSDTRIVRNGQKILATVNNAQFVADLSAEHDGFGRMLAQWPVSDQVGLMDLLKSRASRLGGMTGQYFLRFSGWDAWILSKDVVAALIREGVVEKTPTSKKALAAVGEAFNAWAEESGRSRTEISRTLAYSVG